MEMNSRRYPIGIQNFEQLRNLNRVYVDKTELIYRLIKTDQIYFFSRPRRFGKSLLVSTLEAYFLGKKELFHGLFISSQYNSLQTFCCSCFRFITGISKFSQLSIFSELNNLKNISMRDDFSALCGITEQELLTQLKPDIERIV